MVIRTPETSRFLLQSSCALKIFFFSSVVLHSDDSEIREVCYAALKEMSPIYNRVKKHKNFRCNMDAGMW